MDEENQRAAALTESEQRFRQIFEGNRSVKLIIDAADGRIEEANPAACEFYGYSRKRLLELRISDLNVLPPEEIQAEMALAQTEKRLYFNFRHRLASSELRDVEVYSGPIDTAHGQRLYSIIHDVTQSKRAEAELKMFQIFSRHATDAHILLDERAHIRYVNELACKFLGYSEAELLQMSVPDIDPGYNKAAVQAHFEQCKLGRMPPFETKHRRKDSSVFPVEITSTAVFFQGEWLAFTACRDITARKDAESRLRLAASVFTHAHAGVMICDANEAVLDVNPAFTRITGYGREEILGHTPRRLSSGRHGPSFFRALWQAVEADGHWEGEIWNRRKSGESYPQRLTISGVHDPQGRLTHYIGVFTDISRFKEQQEQLEFLAHHDALTRLPNRALLSDRLAQALAHARRAGTVLAVCFVELDGFKGVNDRHGHAVGDALLTELARRLRQGLREGDTAARLGGDEFVLLLTGLRDATECDQVLTRLLRAVAEPVELQGSVCSVSASAGVSVFPDNGSDPDSLLRHADHAMYRAKQSGKNQFALYDAIKDL